MIEEVLLETNSTVTTMILQESSSASLACASLIDWILAGAGAVVVAVLAHVIQRAKQRAKKGRMKDSAQRPLSDMADSMENIANPETVQKARIALLAHNTSQMQQYKYYMLTLVLGFFGVMELSSRVRDLIPCADAIVYVAFGAVGCFFFYSFARFIWYGKIVGGTSYAPLTTWSSKQSQETLTGCLSDRIGEYARESAGEDPYPLRWLFHLGDNQSVLVITCAVLFLVLMCLQFGNWGGVLLSAWLFLIVSTLFEITS